MGLFKKTKMGMEWKMLRRRVTWSTGHAGLKIVHDWPNEFDEYMTDEREGSGIFSMVETLMERVHGLHPLIKNMVLEL